MCLFCGKFLDVTLKKLQFFHGILSEDVRPDRHHLPEFDKSRAKLLEGGPQITRHFHGVLGLEYELLDEFEE
jgi:hypothetical protein